MVRAKFYCSEKKVNTGITNADGLGFSIKFLPVGADDSEENKEFFKWTPGGSIEISTINADAAAQFEPGKSYYVDFTACA